MAHPALTEIEDLVAEGAFEEAVQRLRDFASSQLGKPTALTHQFQQYYDMSLTLSAEQSGLSRNRMMGLLREEDAQLQQRQLLHRLLQLSRSFARAVTDAETKTAAPLPVAEPDLSRQPKISTVPEKVWGRDNLQSISWLAQGLASSAAICRVITSKSIGTGFLLPGGFVLTNNHVVPSAELAADADLEFNFERDIEGRMRRSSLYPVDPGVFATDATLDYTLLKVGAAPEEEPLSRWGHVTLGQGRKVELGDPVTIIQHPDGGEKRIALTSNDVVYVDAPRLLYRTDTKKGSSGAPVFNEAWEVVALHRAGGHIEVGDAGDKIYANEGILIDHILAHLEQVDPGLAARL
ncbi:MAG: trypsin-like peptidase domain-containing protein [Pseudomonadota bacterium]